MVRPEPERRLSGGPPEQAELIRRASRGDDDAFAALVARLLPRLRRWALVRTGDADDADEVVQRTLIRLHRSLPSFQHRSRLSSWAYRILRNAATDLERERSARPGDEPLPPPDSPSTPAGSSDPLGQLHARRMAAAVRAFFDALPPRQREVLELVDHQGLKPVEVARRLGMNPVTVRANLFKARRAVRERVLEQYPELKEGYQG